VVSFPLTYQITAINLPTSFGATNLPPGLNFNPSNGVISGTPTTAGSTNTIITATNGNGTDTETLVFNITAGPPPEITSALAVSAATNTAFSYTIVAANNPASFGATGLPAGLSINPTTGVISGTVTTTGIKNVTITATNANGTDTKTLVLSFLANLSVGRPTVTSPNVVSPGSNAVDTDFNTSRWESTHGVDPAWIYIDLGTSKAIRKVVLKWEAAAGKDYKLQVTDDPNGTWIDMVTVVGNTTGGEKIYDNLSFVGRYVRMYGTARTSGYGYSLYNFEVWGADAPQPSITSPLAASGIVNTAFSYQIVATNSPTSYGATGLPSGLSIDANGLISGSPTAAGSTNITLTATNADGSDTETLVLTVTTGPVPVINSALTASGTINTAFSYAITATNSPTSFNATGLPSGLSIDPGTGVISGTPTGFGSSNVTITAANAHGSDTETLVLTIASNLANLSLNMNATASSVQGGNAIAMGNDSSTANNTTRWAAADGTYPQWWRVDLGQQKVIARVDINWYQPAGRVYKYRLETSNDDAIYTTIVDKTAASPGGNTITGLTSDTINPTVTARYVRVTITSSTGGNASFYDLSVFGGSVPTASTLAFSASLYSGAEGAAVTSATITVRRTGDTSAAVGVTASTTTGGTATAGSDYTATSTTLSWAAGDTADKTFTVPILADNLAEGNETVALQLASPTGGAALGTQATASLTIVDRPFDAWRVQVFGANANTPQAQPLADYDGDGIDNLTELYLGGNPTVADAEAVTVGGVSPGGKPQISFIRSLTATGVIFMVQATDSLTGTWETIASKTGAAAWATLPGVTVNDNASTGEVTVTDTDPLIGHRFLRVVIERTTD
jgi:hypothetical protein